MRAEENKRYNLLFFLKDASLFVIFGGAGEPFLPRNSFFMA
jgi:hypothetical protein